MFSLLRLAYLILLEVLMLYLQLLASSQDCTWNFGRGDVQHVRLGAWR